MVSKTLKQYIEAEVLPQYDGFDAAHQRDHADMVIEQSKDEKYADGGYLKLWFPESPNAQRLEALRVIIRDEKSLKFKFEEIFERLCGNK